VLPNGNDSSSVDVARPNVISPISRPPLPHQIRSPFPRQQSRLPWQFDGLVTGTRNRKSESTSIQQRVGRNRRTPLPTSWRARKGLPSWIREAEKSPHQDARSWNGLPRRTLGRRQCSRRRF